MKNTGILLIMISLLFAILMLVVAWVAPDRDTKMLWVNLLIATWWVPYSILTARQCRSCKAS